MGKNFGGLAALNISPYYRPSGFFNKLSTAYSSPSMACCRLGLSLLQKKTPDTIPESSTMNGY